MRRDFTEEERRSILYHLNEQQDIYFVSSLIEVDSKNLIFISYKRIYKNKDSNENNSDQNRYALKLVPYYDDYTRENFNREQNIISLFYRNPEIIKYEKVIQIEYEFENHILIPMKFYENIDLQFYLIRNINHITEKLMSNITYQAVKILQILKERNVVHNDIKFENFIVISEYPIQIILTDFESAECLLPNEKSYIIGGTILYESPEVLQRQPHDFASDMWSLGFNIYTYLYNELPFCITYDDQKVEIDDKMSIEEKLLSKIYQNDVYNVDSAVSVDAFELIKRMLIIEPEYRITPEDCLLNQWLKNNVADDVKIAAESIAEEIQFGREITDAHPKFDPNDEK